MNDSYEIDLYDQQDLEHNLSAESRDEDATVDGDGFAIVSASGFAIVSASGFAIVSASGFAIV